MSDRVIITKYKNAKLIALLKDDRVWDILGVRDTSDVDFKTGDVYKAKVINVQKNINAAFIRVMPGVKAFMDLGSRDEVRPEDEIIVQIVKEAFGEKEMVVTRAFSVSGKYLALTGGRHGVGISRKIEGERRKELSELLYSLCGTDTDTGIVVRTNAENAANSEIEEEYRELSEKISEIRRKASFSVPHIRLYSELSPESAYIRDLRETPEKIVTDDPETYEALKSDFKGKEDIYEKISLYSDDYPLIKLCRLEAAVDEVFKRVIHLKSGGNLIIDRTEACHVLDVNSGKNTDKLSKPELILKTNIEAVREAARQIRLRNLSGMILIDLINMDNTSDRKSVIEELKQEIKKDRLRCEFVDITGLGIAELTREKRSVPLREVLND